MGVTAMNLFKKKEKPSSPLSSQFPADQYEPVIRSSICTGEMTACMQDRSSGKLTEIMLIRSPYDLAQFGKMYGVDVEKMRTIY